MNVEDRWWVIRDGRRVRSERYGMGKRYKVRWRDPSGRHRAQSFDRKADADAFAATQAAAILRGTYVDPAAGRLTLAEYSRDWLDGHHGAPATRYAVNIHVTRHILPYLGDVPLSQIRPTLVKQWIKALGTEGFSPATIRVIFGTLRAMLYGAVDDGYLAVNPVIRRTITLPAVGKPRVSVWTAEQCLAVTEAIREPYRVLLPLGYRLGLRQGEAFGLAVDDVDFLRRRVHVRRQVVRVGSAPIFAETKSRKERTVPLSPRAAEELAEHIRKYPPVAVTHPWRELDGPPVTARLLLSVRGHALNRWSVNQKVWKPALRAAGVTADEANGYHVLRHTYASLLLAQGVSALEVAEYLGHASPGFTLSVYGHLVPDSADRARSAVDTALTPAQQRTRKPSPG